MFGSKARLADKRLALKVLEQAKAAYYKGDREQAAWFLSVSRELKKHIRDHDYTEEDKQIKKWELDRKWQLFQVNVLRRTTKQFENIWRQPTDPITGDAMPCFPESERIADWIYALHDSLVVELKE